MPWRSSTLTSSIDTSASSSSRAEGFLRQWPSIGTCQQHWLIGSDPLLGSTPSMPPVPVMTRTRLAVWLRRSAAMITDGLGARTAVWSGGHESRAGK